MIGCMFSGYGGLSMAVADVLGMGVAWHAEVEPAACRTLAHHWPDVPNLGDVSAVDWAAAPPVDVITAGFPCQDLSYAGKGAGIKEGTRSGLWSAVAAAVRGLGPRLVVLENVAAIVARRPGLDVVLDDLAACGYDVRWACLRAADVGAPHGRDRWFLVGWPAADADGGRGPQAVQHDGRGAPAGDRPGLLDERDRVAGGVGPVGGLTLLPTPQTVNRKSTAAMTNAAGNRARRTSSPPGLEQTAEMLSGARPHDLPPDEHLPPRTREMVQRLLPTPVGTDALGARNATAHRPNGNGRHHSGTTLNDVAYADRWGDYAAAIHRWEHILGRPAPDPTTPSPKTGRPQLSPRLVEWMMGLPPGHVTDVPDTTRTQQLKMLGNGVVPAQAAAALRMLLAVEVPA